MALDYSQIKSGIEQQQAAGHANIMDALAAYNQAQQQAYFAQPAAPVAAPAAPVAAPAYEASAYEAPQGFLNLTSPAPATSAQTGIATLPISGPAYDPTKIKDIESLYQYALGRPADVSGKQYYAGIEAGGITPEEYQRFIQIAQPELQVQKAYQDVLGRKFDIPGAEYYTQQLQSGALTPDNLRESLAYGAQGLEDRLKAQAALGKDIFAPAEFLKGTSGMGYEDIVNYITANVNDPVRIAQAAARYGVDPNEILQAYQGKSPYSLEQIQGYLETGQKGYADRYQDILESTIGDTDYLNKFEQNRTNIERNLGLDPGTLKSTYNVKDFSTQSIEDIEKALQQSGANRYQEAARLSELSKTLYGFTDEQAKTLRTDLLKGNKDLFEGKATDPLAKEYYDALIKGQVTPELNKKIIADAAKKAPDSPYFKANPQDLLYAKSIGDLQRGEESSGQYGSDPRTGFSLISEKAFNKALDEKGDVFIGGMQDIYDNTSLQYLGADPHSKYQGHIGRGTGALGVTASKDEITDFARIEKELNRLGGVQRQVDPDTGSAMDVVYVERKDPESDRTYKIPVTAEQFFRMQLSDKYPAVSEEDPSSQARFTRNFDSTSAYDYYKQTKNALDTIATNFYKDPSKVPQYKDIKQTYDDLNDKTKNLYLWRGRTNTLDPEAMKKLGIEDPTADDSHIEVYLEKKGDYLVPKLGTDQKPMITPFKFSDPNTSSGFFGDLFNFAMEVMNTPIGMALGSYLVTPPFPGGTAPLAGATSSLAAQLPSGLSSLIPGINSEMIARSLISSGISALPAAVGGDFDRFGRAFLTNLAGSGVQMGAGALGANPFVSKLLGAATTAGLSDRDIEDALTRVATSEGINALLNKIPTGDFDKKLMAAFAPSILSGNISPQDLMRIAQAVNQPKK